MDIQFENVCFLMLDEDKYSRLFNCFSPHILQCCAGVGGKDGIDLAAALMIMNTDFVPGNNQPNGPIGHS